ncbi:MAG: DNA internalization-related competence protein ComEC/Rec2 [Pseudomonadota bacterium]
MLIAAAALFTGLSFALWWPWNEQALFRLLHQWPWLVLVVVICAAFVARRDVRQTLFFPLTRWRSSAVLAVLALATGFWLGEGALVDYREQLLPLEWERRDVRVEGRVLGTPRRREFGWTFDFQVNKAVEADLPDLGRIRLNWYQRGERASGAPRPSDRWRFRVRLKRPHGFLNPGGFDYQRWLVGRGIAAKGYVRGDTQRLVEGRGGLRERIWRGLRQQNSDSAGLAAALVLGIRNGLDRDLRQHFVDTGTAHLLAISGLHVGMVAGLGFFAARGVLWCAAGLAAVAVARRGRPGLVGLALERGFTRFRPGDVCWLSGLVTATAYTALAGWTLPTRRALLMYALLVLAVLWRHSASSMHSWALALMVVLFLSPLSLFSASVWLSFGAVAWIVMLSPHLPGHWGRWRQAAGLQLFLPLCLWPLVNLWFGQAALLGALANMLLIPLVAFIVLPLSFALSLMAVVSPEALALLLPWTDAALAVLSDGMARVADWPLSNGHRPGMTPFSTLALSALLAVVLVYYRRPATVAVAAMAIAAIILWPSSRPGHGRYEVSVLDVGQGLSVGVTTQHHHLVFDLGPQFPSGFNTAEAVVGPWLRQRGVDRIDRLVLSHGDSDHAGAAADFVAAHSIGDVLTGEVGRVDIPARPCERGQQWRRDGVEFRILWPPAEPNRSGRGNHHSCVLRIDSPQGSALLTGDIEHRAERQLLASVARLRADFLLVPHHGSKSSSSAAFVEAVRPRWAIISAGYLNRFGMPATSVMERYRAAGADLHTTAECGELRWKGGEVRCYRSFQGQRWRHRLGSGF